MRRLMLVLALLLVVPSLAFGLGWTSLSVVPAPQNALSTWRADPGSTFTGKPTTRVMPGSEKLVVPYVAWQETWSGAPYNRVVNPNAQGALVPFSMSSHVVYPSGLWRYEAYVCYVGFLPIDDAAKGANNLSWNGGGPSQTSSFLYLGTLATPQKRASVSYGPATSFQLGSGWELWTQAALAGRALDAALIQAEYSVHMQGGKDGAGKWWYAYVVSETFVHSAANPSMRVVGRGYVSGLTTPVCIALGHAVTLAGVPTMGGAQTSGVFQGATANPGSHLYDVYAAGQTTISVQAVGQWQAWAGYQENLAELPELPDASSTEPTVSITPSSSADPTGSVPPGSAMGDITAMGFTVPGSGAALSAISGGLSTALNIVMWPFTAFSALAGTAAP